MSRRIRPLRLIIALSTAVVLAYLAFELQLHYNSPNLYYLRRAASFFPTGLLSSSGAAISTSRPQSPASVASLTTSAAMSSSEPPASGSAGDMTSEGCGEIPRIENPRTYKPKGKQRKTPGGMSYYEVVPKEVTRPDLAIIQYYDVRCTSTLRLVRLLIPLDVRIGYWSRLYSDAPAG